jgi:uncharacterized membrane protein
MAWPPSSGWPAAGSRRQSSPADATAPYAKTPRRSSATANDSSVTTQPDEEQPSGPTPPAQALQTAGDALPEEPSGDALSRAGGRVAWAASFSGPLPPPDVLAAYEQVMPGAAREIMDQWKVETAHRHHTIDGLREIDRDSMRSYYEGERHGQRVALTAFLAVIALAIVVAIVLGSEAVAIAAIVTGGASAVWALRRRSDGPAIPTDLASGDALEKPSEQ